MIRTVAILLRHDLAVALQNKTLYLIACIPLFVYATLTMVDPAGAGRATIALLPTESYAPAFLAGLGRAPASLSVRWVPNEAEAMRLLSRQEVGGLLLPDGADATRVRLTVVRQASVETLAILHSLSALQAAAEGRGPDWISDIRSLQKSSLKLQTLPTWLAMMALLIGFIVLPAQVAEEKEKLLLLGWLQAPVRESEWLAAKLAYGMVLLLASAAGLQLMSGEAGRVPDPGYLAILCAGGFCFAALGICLGLLCRTQASARTFGVLCYLPLLLPVALSDLSPDMRRIAPLLPSYQFHEPIRALLLEGGGSASVTPAGLQLTAIGLLACLVSRRLIKRRWLM